MKPVSDLFPRLLPYVPGCSEPLAHQALVDAAIAFCEEAMVLREALEPVVTQPGVADYDLEVPPQHMLGRVVSVSIDGIALQPLPSEPTFVSPTVLGKPSAYLVVRQDDELVLRVFPTPNEAYTLDVFAVLLPSRDAVNFSNVLVTTWADAVVNGALSKLLAMPGQPFSDAGAAALATAYYTSRVKRARMDGSLLRSQGSLSVRLRSF